MRKSSHPPLIILLISVGWSLLGTMLAVLVMYIPGALDLVDDERLGRASAIILLPSLVLMAAAGLCAGLKKYLPAVAITAFVLLGCAALDAMIIVRALGG